MRQTIREPAKALQDVIVKRTPDSILRRRRPIYIISDSMDYSTLISDDTGPGFARRQGWETARLNDLEKLSPKRVPVIDPRLSSPELTRVAALVTGGKHLIIRIVDQVESTPTAFGQFVEKVAKEPAAWFCGPYGSVGFASQIVEARGPMAYHVLPYAYDIHREMAPDGRRHRSVALFGRCNSTYPSRTRLVNELGRRPWLRPWIDKLEHPGYPDVGEAQTHTIVGDAFVEYLAQHLFVFVDPSKFGYELQRYSECAYAGCVPVGFPPDTFEPDLASMILPFDPAHPEISLLRILRRSRRDLAEIAQAYRTMLSEQRDRGVLTAGLMNWWIEVQGSRGGE